MMESRPRVTKRTLIFGVIFVGVVTFVVLVAEGVLAFRTKTSHTIQLIDESKASGEKSKKSSRGGESGPSAATAERSDLSQSTSSKGAGDASAKRSSDAAADSTQTRTDSEKKTEDGVQTSVSGVELCRSKANGVIVSTSRCHGCSEHDKQLVTECLETGRVEQIVTCESGKPMKRRHRACIRNATEEEAERKFFVFEAVNFGVGVAAYVVVALRRKKLDSALAKKIEQQLASGV